MRPNLSSFLHHSQMKRTVLLIALAFAATACTHKGLPEGIMTHDQMVDFLTDAYMLEGFYAVETQYRYDALSDEVIRVYDSILNAQGLDRETVEKSLEYYGTHPEAYKKVHEEVLDTLDKGREEMRTKIKEKRLMNASVPAKPTETR